MKNTESNTVITESADTAVITTNNTAVAKVRKSQRGKWGKVGAPPKEIKWKSNSFTIADLIAANPEVCALTIRKKVQDRVENGELVQLAKPLKKEGVGRPSLRYMSAKQVANLAALKNKNSSKKHASVEVPTANVSDPAPVNVEAVAETATA